MKLYRISPALVRALVLCMILTGCAISLAMIDTTITAIETLLPIILQAVGVNPAAQQEAQAWLGTAAGATDQVTAILDAGGPADQVAIKITAAVSGVLAKEPQIAALPLPSNILTAVSAVATDLDGILTQYGNPITPPAGSQHFGAKKPVTSKANISLNASQKALLNSYHVRAQVVLLKLKAAARK
jgi:hypothetical protein